MSQHKCELCGTPVKVVGKTTKHYEPLGTVNNVQNKQDIIELCNYPEEPNAKNMNENLVWDYKLRLDKIHALLMDGKVKEPEWPEEIKPEVLTGIFNMDRVKASEYINAMRIACIKAWKDAQG